MRADPVNRYRIVFKIMDGDDYLGEYTAHVDAVSAGEAERKAAAELKAANVDTNHEYLAHQYIDMGPSNEEGPSQ